MAYLTEKSYICSKAKCRLPKVIMRTIYIYAGWTTAIVALLCIACLLICNHIVVKNAKGKVFSETDSITPTKWGLLLGTTPQTRIGNRQNLFYKNRIDAAVQLYKAGKIEKILVSGAEKSLEGVNEVVCMRDSLVARGVDAGAIVLDGKGNRTLESVVRAVNVYDIHQFIVISQRFHNERAIYQAEHLDLDVSGITGFNADDVHTGTSFLIYLREYLARVKMFLDLFLA